MTGEPLREISGVAFGTRLHGRLPGAFGPYLLPADLDAAHDLEVHYEPPPAIPSGLPEPVWESRPGDHATPGRLVLFPVPDGFGLTVCGAEGGVFRATGDRLEMLWETTPTGAAHHLFAHVLPLWLEARGIPVLHGSAVEIDGRAVGFLGAGGVGKSVLTAELVDRGCGFLADDALALIRDETGAWRCLPGPPLLRLWPEGLRDRLHRDPADLPRVTDSSPKRRLPSNPASAPLPLAALYLLDRRPVSEGPPTVTPLSPRDALLALLEHGVAAGPATALGLAEQRFEFLADLSATLPVQVLRYAGNTSADRLMGCIHSGGRS